LTGVAVVHQAVGRLGITCHRIDANADASRFSTTSAPKSFCRRSLRNHRSLNGTRCLRLSGLSGESVRPAGWAVNPGASGPARASPSRLLFD
jgi:hypothetical protein